jgi:hypothetical protein
MFCLYVQPGASGDPVGHPVLVGDEATHDVVVHGGGLVTFLGVEAGVATVAMSNMVAMGPEVAIRVRSLLLFGSLLPAPLPPPPLDLAVSWSRRVLTWLVRLELGDKRGVRGNKLL